MAITIPKIDEEVARITITLKGKEDLVLHITPESSYWLSEIGMNIPPKELQCVFMGPAHTADAINRFNDWKAKQNGNQSSANYTPRVQAIDSGNYG